jgi:antitoxin MazE6
MKTAISIPDPVFKAAEQFARRLGLSRSALYTQAVERYLREHRHYGVTEKLNEVYGEVDSNLDSELAAMQHTTLQTDNIS